MIIKDIEGNEYPVVKIGEQYWLTENLRVSTYRDGSPISSYDYAKYETYEMQKAYGHFYAYNAMSATSKALLPPAGCRVPTRTQFEQLFNHAGGFSNAAIQLKGTNIYPDDHPRWNTGAIVGSNPFLFDAYKTGMLMSSVYVEPLESMVHESYENICYFWTDSTRRRFLASLFVVYNRYIQIFSNDVISTSQYAGSGAFMPIRCIITDTSLIEGEEEIEPVDTLADTDPLFFGAGF